MVLILYTKSIFCSNVVNRLSCAFSNDHKTSGLAYAPDFLKSFFICFVGLIQRFPYTQEDKYFIGTFFV